MNLRITLTALAAISIAAVLGSPADARQDQHKSAGPTSKVDVAAVPAYPTDANRNVAVRHAASPALKRSRSGNRASREANPHQRASNAESGSGIVRSAKTGAVVHVSPKWADKFQAYIDDLEGHGAAVYYMGGFRKGRCSLASQHPCGSALDVCQDRRGHVSGAKDCNLPGPVEMASIAARHGLFEGGVWCGNPDYGHVQGIATGSICAARGTFGPRQHRLASRAGGRL